MKMISMVEVVLKDQNGLQKTKTVVIRLAELFTGHRKGADHGHTACTAPEEKRYLLKCQ
jgi:hypothetical protein